MSGSGRASRIVISDEIDVYCPWRIAPDDLSEKMRRMLSLTDAERGAMGLAGREKMIQEFDESKVIGSYMEAIREIELEAIPG
jgi:hypothetical protein